MSIDSDIYATQIDQMMHRMIDRLWTFEKTYPRSPKETAACQKVVEAWLTPHRASSTSA